MEWVVVMDPFAGARLLGQGEPGIILQTHRGRNIVNSIEPESDERARRKDELLRQKYGSQWRQRRPPTGVYNCAGHIWANRRTSILEDLERQIQIVLDDDGYRRLGTDERPCPGDLVLYRDLDIRIGFLHVGLIVSLEPGISPTSPPIPWVLSKWDSASGEYLHRLPDVPFRQMFDVVAECWTDRPHS